MIANGDATYTQQLAILAKGLYTTVLTNASAKHTREPAILTTISAASVFANATATNTTQFTTLKSISPPARLAETVATNRLCDLTHLPCDGRLFAQLDLTPDHLNEDRRMREVRMTLSKGWSKLERKKLHEDTDLQGR